jgi:magnesium-transporting ATPase (P-type)
MIGAAGGSMCMWIIGAYIAVRGVNPSNAPSQLSGGGIAAIFFFYLWTAFYTPSWNGTPWVINSEMFSQNTRSLGQASAAASNWFWNFIISRFTPQMFNTMGYGVYFFFACLMILSIPFVYFFIPETKGIPLEKMDELFEIKGTRKAHGILMERLLLEDQEFRHDAEGAGLTVEKTKNEQMESV